MPNSYATARLGLKPANIGTPIKVITNSFPVSRLPTGTFEHYDAFPDFERPLSRARALEIIDKLQIQDAPTFLPRAAFDGQRNMFRSKPLNMANNTAVFQVYFTDAQREKRKGVRVRITRVATIEPRSLLAVINGDAGYGSESLTALTLLNVLIRMQPIMSYPSNARSFFTKKISEDLGGGLEVWRGLFQSVRPTISRLLINVDVASAVMYNGGNLVGLIMAFLGARSHRDLYPSHLQPTAHARLNSVLKHLLVSPTVPARPGQQKRYRKIMKIVMTSADQYMFFNDSIGQQISITNHFLQAYAYHLKHPNLICVDVGNDVVFPLEVLEVKEGQLFKKLLPPSAAPRALKFATQSPSDRMKTIMHSRAVLGYGDSDYIRQSGMAIDEQLISINARVLDPPPIQWGADRCEVPRGGAWNVLGKKFHKPEAVKAWAVVIFEPRLPQNVVMSFLLNFHHACEALGMRFPKSQPPVIHGRPNVDTRGYQDDMEKAGQAAIESFKGEFRGENPRPTFILVILPDSAIDIRTAVKSWGDCIRGCPTQCMKSGKLAKANNQYCNNLALKLNTKIGGVNSIPSLGCKAMEWLTEAPTMVIGADVSHAGPDSDRPSISGMVSSVDEFFSQYVASTYVQEARMEIIANLDNMIETAIRKFTEFWRVVRQKNNTYPYRIIFYRDGISEGQFKQVGEQEVQRIKSALVNLWKKRNLPGRPPGLTFIIVAKRHHVRFFPKDRADADRSGNCPPGLVVDTEIVSPVDYDFYLQSHGGLLGTSRPSHYSVIEDSNKYGPDKLQAMSYTLCHTYARATRSVSIPAPVYYADIVCARGRFHSGLIHDGSDPALSLTSNREATLAEHQQAFRKLNAAMENSMYFM